MSLTLASGPPITLSDSLLGAYHAAHAGQVLLTGSALRWLSFRGASAAAALNGLVTNDVDALVDGTSQLSVALTPKGKIISDLIVVRTASDVFLVASQEASAGEWHDVVKKYVNQRLAKTADETELLSPLLLAGPLAGTSVAALTSVEGVTAVQIPLLGRIPCYAIFVADGATDVEAMLAPMPVTTSPAEPLMTVLRVEEGLPTIGRDMNETTLVQEAGLDNIEAVSFTKGCYTGQETVARVHFRGHVNRHLRGLLSEAPLPPGATVFSAEGNTIGDVRSSIVSPRLGPIALGMIRRETDIGSSVWTESESGKQMAKVVALPFEATRALA